MDTCFAVLKTLFEGAYPYSYDLEELARYYVAYHELMAHWESVIPGVILHVEFEQLVTDTKGQVQRLLDYCGLSWEARCVEFHKHAEASTTGNAVQVRQEVYRNSIGRWRNYREDLLPVVRILKDAGIETGR